MDLEALQPLAELYAARLPADSTQDLLRVTANVELPLLEVLSVDEATGMAVARGPYGVGGVR